VSRFKDQGDYTPEKLGIESEVVLKKVMKKLSDRLFFICIDLAAFRTVIVITDFMTAVKTGT